jgi:WhiB family redox-sensing transcriptional regulator
MRPSSLFASDAAAVAASLPLAQREELIRDNAACASAGPELFYAEDIAGIIAARAICQGCNVQSLCLQAAIERAEPAGVWGGELFCEGAIVAQKRPRGRPRKDAPFVFVSSRALDQTVERESAA